LKSIGDPAAGTSSGRAKLTLLFPDQDRIVYQPLRDETVHDLGLDALCASVTREEKEQTILLQVLRHLSPSPEAALFRRDVFEDLLAHPQIREKLMKLLEHVRFLNDYGAVRRQPENGASGLWDLLHRLDELRDYTETVQAIGECLADQELKSEGLRRLREGIGRIWRDSGFEGLRQDIAALKADTNSLKSITVGINLNERLEAVSAGLISVNSKPFTRSGLLRHFTESLSRSDSIRPDTEWKGDMNWHPAGSWVTNLTQGIDELTHTSLRMRNPLIAMTLASVPDGSGTRDLPRTMDAALGGLVSGLVRKLRETLNRHAAVSIGEIAGLIPELLFCIRWAEYTEKRMQEGWLFSPAEPRDAENGAPVMAAREFYNMKLIGAEPPDRVVRNSLIFDADHRVYLLTGANRGGKTTLTQAVGQLFILAQAGLRVPAESFVFTPADAVFTHFPADEDKTLDLGRLGEECRRFREQFLQSTPGSVLLLNETFSTTSFEEGYYIARDAVRAMLKKGCRAIYNTHMHKLAANLEEINRDAGEGRAFSLVVRSEGGSRSFRAEVAPPEGSSYARDIAEKYGVTYEKLTEGS